MDRCWGEREILEATPNAGGKLIQGERKIQGGGMGWGRTQNTGSKRTALGDECEMQVVITDGGCNGKEFG